MTLPLLYIYCFFLLFYIIDVRHTLATRLLYRSHSVISNINMTLAVAIGCTSSILRIRAGYDTAIIFIDFLKFLRIDVILNLSKQ